MKIYNNMAGLLLGS